MLIEIEESDFRQNGQYFSGLVVAADGCVVASWYYYAIDGVAEVWFDDDPDFWDILSHEQQAFLERQVTIECEKATKDQEDFTNGYAYGGVGP